MKPENERKLENEAKTGTFKMMPFKYQNKSPRNNSVNLCDKFGRNHSPPTQIPRLTKKGS